MKTTTCNECGKELPEGSLRYIININIFADYEDLININDESEEIIEEKIKYILASMEDLNQKDLDDDVYQEFTFVLCKDCRDRLKNKLMTYSNPSKELDEEKITFH